MIFLDQYVHKTIGDLVISIRNTGTITNVTQNPDGNYIVTAANDFKEDDILSIINNNSDEFNDLIILEATSTEFVISTDIGYDFQYTYTYVANAPYYMAEKQQMANEILTQKTAQSPEKYKKYPLILFLRNYTENLRSPDYVRVTFTLVIVTPSQQGWNSDQRDEKTFLPILELIYDDLLQAMADSNEIQIYGVDDIPHDKELDPLIDGNPLPDYLDGIMLNFIDLPFKRKC